MREPVDAVLCVTGEVADFSDLTRPPPDWTSRTEAVERELHHRYGRTPELTAADEQSHRIRKLLNSGQLTSQVISLRAARTGRGNGYLP